MSGDQLLKFCAGQPDICAGTGRDGGLAGARQFFLGASAFTERARL